MTTSRRSDWLTAWVAKRRDLRKASVNGLGEWIVVDTTYRKGKLSRDSCYWRVSRSDDDTQSEQRLRAVKKVALCKRPQ
jgi:hypothetical protein